MPLPKKSDAEKLSELASLFDRDLLSSEEFEQAKAEVAAESGLGDPQPDPGMSENVKVHGGRDRVVGRDLGRGWSTGPTSEPAAGTVLGARFPLLSTTALALRVFGILLILAGLYVGVWGGVIEPNLPGHGFGTEDYAELFGGMAALLFGLGAVALGEIVGVLLAIEDNTRPG